jgi:hypothetical protein
MAYCLRVTLKHQASQLAPGLTPRSILEKFSTVQMVDVQLPTTDGRYLILPRYTQPDRDLKAPPGSAATCSSQATAAKNYRRSQIPWHLSQFLDVS